MHNLSFVRFFMLVQKRVYSVYKILRAFFNLHLYFYIQQNYFICTLLHYYIRCSEKICEAKDLIKVRYTRQKTSQYLLFYLHLKRFHSYLHISCEEIISYFFRVHNVHIPSTLYTHASFIIQLIKKGYI